MIALDVSSAAGRPPFGGIQNAIRNTVEPMLRSDPATRYALCFRLERSYRDLYRPALANAHLRLLQDPWNPLLIAGAKLIHSFSSFAPRTPRIPKLVTVHDLNVFRNPHWVRPRWAAQRRARIATSVARADLVLTPSQAMADEVCDEFALPAERVRAIPHGVDMQAFAPAPLAAIQRVRARYGEFVLSVGLFTPRKNVPALVRAMARVPTLRLVLVGRRSDGAAEVDAAIEEIGASARVDRLAGVSHAELVALYSAARAYAAPSLYEGFGLTLLEAMACGAPVVCSRASCLPEVAGGAALLADATDADAIADAIARVAHDDALAHALREKGTLRARAMSWSRSAEQTRKLYAEVAGV